MKKIKYVLILFLFIHIHSFAKKKITFISEDGVTVTADLYLKGNDYPYVIMFHQDGSSRGEYNEIAEKIMNLNYNCLAVDLRCGDRINYTENETAQFAKNNGFQSNYIESEKDVRAAVAYAFKKSDQAVILFGSSFSASISLKVAINNARISAVVAFDPGEYLKPVYILQDNLKEIDKPVFVAANKSNYSYIKNMFANVPSEYVTMFTPVNGKGEHGSKALWADSENSKEYWLALMMFFSKLY